MDYPPCTHDDIEAPCPACTAIELGTESLDALFHSVRELVDGLHVRHNAFAVVDVGPIGESYRYAQVLADRDGALCVEVSSTEATDDGFGSAALTPAEELELVRLRYLPPDGWSPNWHRVFVEPWPRPAPVAAALVVHSLLWVLGGRPDELRVTTGHAETISVMRGVTIAP